MEKILKALKNSKAFIEGMMEQGAIPVTLCKLASDIHQQIQEAEKLIKENKGQISDGYHTFDELYENRIALFIALCKRIEKDTDIITWRSEVEDGWFIMGIYLTEGNQITYHLPESKWKQTEFCTTIINKDTYKYDGHTPADVLEQIKKL